MSQSSIENVPNSAGILNVPDINPINILPAGTAATSFEDNKSGVTTEAPVIGVPVTETRDSGLTSMKEYLKGAEDGDARKVGSIVLKLETRQN